MCSMLPTRFRAGATEANDAEGRRKRKSRRRILHHLVCRLGIVARAKELSRHGARVQHAADDRR